MSAFLVPSMPKVNKIVAFELQGIEPWVNGYEPLPGPPTTHSRNWELI